MTTLYQIRNWDVHFENSQSRKYRAVSWVPIPNKHDGKSFRRLMQLADGMEIYAAWILLVQVASKCPKRGVLADDDGPLSAGDVSLKCDAPEHVMEKAMTILSSPEIGWLVACSQHAGSGPVADWESTTLNRNERTERNTPLPPKGDGFRIRGLSKAELADTATVLRWLDENRLRLALPDTHETNLRVLAAAAIALADGKNPPRLFRAIVRKLASGDFNSLSDDRLLEAKRRLQTHEQSATIPEVRTALATLKGIE